MKPAYAGVIWMPVMGALSEAKLDELVQAGCPTCGASRLVFGAYLDGRLPIMGGEPVGKLTWCYDGEKFVDGVYEIRCASCKQQLFAADLCPRCDRPGSLAKALESENTFPLLKECPSCQGEELRYLTMVPATVIYERKRAAPPRTDVDPYDPGFHGFRVECRDCATVAECQDRCPLCGAEGPLRQRPG